MTLAAVSLALVASANVARAQTSTTPVPAASARSSPQTQVGLESPWDARKILDDVVKSSQQLQPLLAQMDPQQWYDRKGAPSTYIVQWQTAQRQLNDVLYAARQLSQKTDSLPMSLDVYFRIEALEVTSRSLEEGAQKYASRSSADALSALIAHNFNNRERFRDYIRDLAASMDQNFKIADEEAQRCRGMISRDPALTKRSKKY
ncbi:MAG: hypothetical protein JO091_09615 [Acidobacteriaceae bacterium]|nr:hypothetical protein [Acidobacteriaceae bacterium]